MNTQSILNGLKKYPLIFIAVAFSLVLVGLLYFRSGLTNEQQAELQRLSSEANRQRANITNAALLQDQLNFLIEANKAVKERTLTADGLAQNLQYFYRLEAEVGIKYLDLRPGARATAVKGSAYVPLNYIVNVQGTFLQAITYLKHLEQGAYFCRINSAVASANGSIVTLNLNIDLLGVP